MSSIGPQLPPHLQKRKRTPDDERPGIPPPAKLTRRANEDEIDLDGAGSSSDDDSFGPAAHGPALPQTKTSPRIPTASRGPAGPSLPRKDDSDSRNSLASGATIPKRVIGPAAPPPSRSQPDSDSDSDSDYGPAPPSAADRAAVAAGHLPSAFDRSDSRRGGPAVPEASKRDEWMLAPPPAGGSGAKAPADPTKIKARKFATGRAATAGGGGGGGDSTISSIWTETPEEKARRLADSVLGRGGDAPGGSSHDNGSGKSSSPKGADEGRIRSYTEQTRGKSLYQEHQSRRKTAKEKKSSGDDGVREGPKKPTDKAEEEEDDPSKRAFNWEKDMKARGTTISHAQRRELLTKAADFGGRFQKGSYL